MGNGIAVDGSGRATVTGYTGSSDFPTTAGAYDHTLDGDNDAFVARLNGDGSGLGYATYLGGNDNDVGRAIAVDGSGRATVTGYTGSSDFPTTAGAYDHTLDGDNDAFVARLNGDGSGLEYATFLGGSDGDHGLAIALDGTGRATVTGYTGSSDFPTTEGAYDRTHNNGGWGDVFVAKLVGHLTRSSGFLKLLHVGHISVLLQSVVVMSGMIRISLYKLSLYSCKVPH